IDDEVLALYTDYEGDHTKPFSYIIGCRVSKVENLPSGLDFAVVPEQKYALYTSRGLFPQSLIKTWTEIWESQLKRAFKADFEVYSPRTEEKCFIGDEKEVQVFVGISLASTKK
ncbi:GyrI-like domain-containing protein, partial [Chlamydiota bacterium]